MPEARKILHKLVKTADIFGQNFRPGAAERYGFGYEDLKKLISESSEHYYKVIKLAKVTPEVVKCFATTGAGSHVLLIRTESTKSIEKFLRTIQQWPGIIRTETQLVLSSNKN